MTYPWERADAPEHIKKRQPVMELNGVPGMRLDLPRRRLPDELPSALQNVNFGIAVMSHRGSSNGRLSVLLSSIPENYPIIVSSDSISDIDIARDRQVCEHHGADFSHCSPWGGRAVNAVNTMKVSSWAITLFLNDDVWLAPECVRNALQWTVILLNAGIPLAGLAIPGWESYHNWQKWGFSSWQECLDQPRRLESVPPNPHFQRGPSLFKNPFGACMIVVRDAYNDLGGFTLKYWAEDDVYCHQVWTSDKYVMAGIPGRGYVHFGAQSWHHGEAVEYVNEFKDATGMIADESGRLQVESMVRWREKLRPVFLKLGGTDAV